MARVMVTELPRARVAGDRFVRTGGAARASGVGRSRRGARVRRLVERDCYIFLTMAAPSEKSAKKSAVFLVLIIGVYAFGRVGSGARAGSDCRAVLRLQWRPSGFGSPLSAAPSSSRAITVHMRLGCVEPLDVAHSHPSACLCRLQQAPASALYMAERSTVITTQERGVVARLKSICGHGWHGLPWQRTHSADGGAHSL